MPIDPTEIKALRARGLTRREIAEIYHVSPSTISNSEREGMDGEPAVLPLPPADTDLIAAALHVSELPPSYLMPCTDDINQALMSLEELAKGKALARDRDIAEVYWQAVNYRPAKSKAVPAHVDEIADQFFGHRSRELR